MRVPLGIFVAALVLLVTAAQVFADGVYPSGKISKPIAGYKGGRLYKPDYSYGYGIDDKYSGVKLDVKESRKGDQTKGQYVSKLPDGRRQKVSYYVDGKSGYVADVKYDGEAKHPIPIKKPVKPTKYASVKPYKPIKVPYKPVVVPHKPVTVVHKPVVVPHKPVTVVHKPVVVPHKPVIVPHKVKKVLHKPVVVPYKPVVTPSKPSLYAPPPIDDDLGIDNDIYATYGKRIPSESYQGYLQDISYPGPGQKYSQYGSAFDPYTHSSKLFQQQLFGG